DFAVNGCQSAAVAGNGNTDASRVIERGVNAGARPGSGVLIAQQIPSRTIMRGVGLHVIANALKAQPAVWVLRRIGAIFVVARCTARLVGAIAEVNVVGAGCWRSA